LALLALAEAATASSCLGPPEALDPCSTFVNTDVIFLGTAVGFFTTEIPVTRYDGTQYTVPSRRLNFLIEERFKGLTGDSVALVPGGAYGCGYQFELGRQYLVYAHRGPGNRLVATSASLTQPTQEVSDLLRYLRARTAGTAVTLLYGRWPRVWSVGPRGLIFAANETGQVLQSRTNGRGRFWMELPGGGRYTITAASPNGAPLGEPQTLTIFPGTCQGVELGPR
jgi:hypothetical protein